MRGAAKARPAAISAMARWVSCWLAGSSRRRSLCSRTQAPKLVPSRANSRWSWRTEMQLAQVRRDKEPAIGSQDFEQAGSLRDREGQLPAGKTAASSSGRPPARTWRPWPDKCSA